ncbi:MAG TPA: LPS assembly protein LptD, partial [Bdellovibrionales bacterium]|nr:LPS assembly protein LptD [Bdellovibrionales bacterium]
PGLIVPLKSARQSGFLVPSMEVSGRGGVGLSESYFWAIDRSRDLTFTPTWYERLGFKGHGDYRYVLGPNSYGRLQTAAMKDRLSPQTALPGPEDRWFAWYQHRLDLPQNYVHRMNLTQVSDLRYPRDFPEELYGHGDPALENRMSLTRSTDFSLLTIDGDMYTNLLKASPIANNDDAVHRLPEIRYSLKEQSLMESGFFVGLDVNYVNFARGSSNYDDLIGDPRTGNRMALIQNPDHGEIQRDGRYDPATDVFRAGQRLDIRPSISYPFQIARRFEVRPKISYRETQYRFAPTEPAKDSGFTPTADRRYLQTEVAMRTELTRIYGPNDPGATRLKHSIEPDIAYSTIPWKRRPDHPFFGEYNGLQYSRQFEPVSDSDLSLLNNNTGLQFDYEDRTYDREVVNFGLSNIFTRKTWLHGEPVYKTAAIFRLAQSYDFNEARAERPHPWSSIDGLMDVRLDRFETYTTFAYNGYAQVTNMSSRVKIMTGAQNYLQGTYTRNILLGDEYEIEPNGETRNFGFGAGIYLKYLEAVGQFDYEAQKWALQSFTYALNVRPPGRCWLLKFEQRLVPNGSPQTRASLSFDFGGEGSGAGGNLM